MRKPLNIVQVLEAASGLPPEEWTPDPSQGIFRMTVKVPVLPLRLLNGRVVGTLVTGQSKTYVNIDDPE